MMRYFTRIRDNPEASDYMRPKSLHRLDRQPGMILTQRWDKKEKKWVDDPNLIAYTGIGGADDFKEIDKQAANNLLRSWGIKERPESAIQQPPKKEEIAQAEDEGESEEAAAPGFAMVVLDNQESEAVERHGKHEGQEGKEGRQGGSQPGFTHSENGDGENGKPGPTQTHEERLGEIKRWDEDTFALGEDGTPRSVTVYHGTDDEFADEIAEDGLKRPEADPEGREPAVYFGTQAMAERFGTYLAIEEQEEVVEEGGVLGPPKHAVVEFEIPATHSGNVKKDTIPEAWKLEQDIPPEWIKAVHYYEFGKPTKTITINAGDETVERHGEHEGQEGVEGQQGGSAPGFTHGNGDGQKNGNGDWNPEDDNTIAFGRKVALDEEFDEEDKARGVEFRNSVNQVLKDFYEKTGIKPRGLTITNSHLELADTIIEGQDFPGLNRYELAGYLSNRSVNSNVVGSYENETLWLEDILPGEQAPGGEAWNKTAHHELGHWVHNDVLDGFQRGDIVQEIVGSDRYIDEASVHYGMDTGRLRREYVADMFAAMVNQTNNSTPEFHRWNLGAFNEREMSDFAILKRIVSQAIEKSPEISRAFVDELSNDRKVIVLLPRGAGEILIVTAEEAYRNNWPKNVEIIDPAFPIGENPVLAERILNEVIERHGDHEGQTGVEGQQGGSAPGFTHTGAEGDSGRQPGDDFPEIGITEDTWKRQPFDKDLAGAYADAIEDEFGLTPDDRLRNATWIAPDGRTLAEGSIHESTSMHAVSAVSGMDTDDITITETQVIQSGLIRHTAFTQGQDTFIVSGVDTLTRQQARTIRSMMEDRVDSRTGKQIQSDSDKYRVGLRLYVVEDIPASIDPISRNLEQISGGRALRLLGLKRSEWRVSREDTWGQLIVSTAPRRDWSGKLITESNPVERHGEHVGQEGVKGQQGGSAPGYSHRGGAAKGQKRKGGPEGKNIKEGAVEPTIARRTVEAAEYNRVFEVAMADNEFSAFVDHNSEEELGNMKALYLSEDGKAGIAIKEHDDGRVEVTQAFNGGAESGTALRMIQQSINEDGVNYAEAFGPFLTAHYARVGLVIDETFPFDDEQAPDNWNYEKHGRPDYHTMRLEK